MPEKSSADSGFGESPLAGGLLEVFLKPQQRLLQPVEVEIAAEVCVLDEQQSDKNRRPFPAQFPFLAAFDQTQRGDRVSGHGERQSPQHQPPGLGKRENLPIPKLHSGNRRDAEEDDRQQNTVDALDQESLHEQSVAGVCRPAFMFDRLIDPLRNLVAKHPLLHPAHRQQIIKRCEQAVPNAVVAPTGMAGVGRNRDFGDGEPFDLEQGRHEAVHSLEKFQVRDALALERPVAAARVADVFAGQPVANPVGNARRRHADEPVALAPRRHARTAGAVEFFERRQQFRQVARVVLQIGIEGDDGPAARRLHARPQRRGLPTVEREPLGANARVARREVFEDFPRPVLAAIIGDDDLVGQLERLRRLADRRDEREQISLLVVAGNDEAEFGRFGHFYFRKNSAITSQTLPAASRFISPGTARGGRTPEDINGTVS